MLSARFLMKVAALTIINDTREEMAQLLLHTASKAPERPWNNHRVAGSQSLRQGQPFM